MKVKSWEHTGSTTVEEAVNNNTGGKAYEFLCDPIQDYKIQNAEKMAKRLMQLAADNVQITIIGDYDADGISATAELFLALSELGATHIRMRLPRRMSEGYGLKETIVDEVSDGVIVTVDNGIAAITAIKKAKDKGLEVLIIDHHLPVMDGDKAVIPPADLVVDPNVDDELISNVTENQTVFHGYCAAGLVFKISQLMIPSTITLQKISALAAIATVADVMDLREDNRHIYHVGIQNILHGNATAGTLALADLVRSARHISEKDIGFRIGPMLNAPGRMYDDGAQKSLTAVLCEDSYQAYDLVRTLSDDNEYRKRERDLAVNRAFDIIHAQNLEHKNPIIVIDPETSEGIVGLVAGEIRETFNSSSFVFTESNGVYKGSGRAADGDNLKASLDAVNALDPDVYVGFGGHAAAAGVTLKIERVNDFIRLMDQVMGEQLPHSDIIKYDIELTPDKLLDTAIELDKYRPFGKGNPEIVLRINHFKLVPLGNGFYQEMGKDSVRFRGAGCEAVGFSMMPKYREIGEPTEMDLIGTLGWHYDNRGNKTPQIEIIDMAVSKTPNKVNIGNNTLNKSIFDLLKQNNMA